MKEGAEATPMSREQPFAAQWRRDEEQLQEQAQPLGAVKAVSAAPREEIEPLTAPRASRKGEKGRPKSQPRQLEKGKLGSAPGGRGTGSAPQRAGAEKRPQTAHLSRDQTELLRPEPVPPGAVCKGDQDAVGPELESAGHTTRYGCERGQRPEGGAVRGRLPAALHGRPFGPRLGSSSLSPSS